MQVSSCAFALGFSRNHLILRRYMQIKNVNLNSLIRILQSAIKSASRIGNNKYKKFSRDRGLCSAFPVNSTTGLLPSASWACFSIINCRLTAHISWWADWNSRWDFTGGVAVRSRQDRVAWFHNFNETRDSEQIGFNKVMQLSIQAKPPHGL